MGNYLLPPQRQQATTAAATTFAQPLGPSDVMTQEDVDTRRASAAFVDELAVELRDRAAMQPAEVTRMQSSITKDMMAEIVAVGADAASQTES